MISIRACKLEYSFSGEPNNNSTSIEKLKPSRYINTKYTMKPPAIAAIALFNFSETIKMITIIKQVSVIIILIKIGNHI